VWRKRLNTRGRAVPLRGSSAPLHCRGIRFKVLVAGCHGDVRNNNSNSSSNSSRSIAIPTHRAARRTPGTTRGTRKARNNSDRTRWGGCMAAKAVRRRTLARSNRSVRSGRAARRYSAGPRGGSSSTRWCATCRTWARTGTRPRRIIIIIIIIIITGAVSTIIIISARARATSGSRRRRPHVPPTYRPTGCRA